MTSDNFEAGWIKIFRSVSSHWLWSDGQPLTRFEAWMLILIETNYNDEVLFVDGELTKCKRGEKYYSLETWAKKFNWSKSKVRRFFKLLESDTMIELKPCQKTTHLIVCNYDTYQSGRIKDEPQMNRRRHPIKEREEVKKKEENKEQPKKPQKVIDLFDFKSSLLELGVDVKIADDWLKVRKAKKGVNTKTAFNAIKRKIEMSGMSANECITKSVENSWSGFDHTWLGNNKNTNSGNLIKR